MSDVRRRATESTTHRPVEADPVARPPERGRRHRPRHRARLLVVAVVAVLTLTGCTEQGAQSTDGFSGRPWSEWTHPTTRPLTFSGPTTDGGTFRSADSLGTVLVVNFWYAGCGPCRSEAATLNALAKEHTRDTRFIGIDVSDDAATATGFERTHGSVYASILDQQQGAAAQLAFAGSRPPKAVPSTFVLDRRGRVTARVTGEANESVLRTLVQDAIDGSAEEGPAPVD